MPLTALAYTVSSMFEGTATSRRVATDSLNMSLPDPDAEAMKDKMTAMDDRFNTDDAYSAVNGFDTEEDGKDSLGNGYSESELDEIDRDKAERKAQEDAQRELERSLAQSREHVNSYSSHSGGSYRSGGSYGSSRRAAKRRRCETYLAITWHFWPQR